MSLKPEPVSDIKKARVLAVLGDSVTTDHISPAGSIKKDSPAGKYLQEHGVKPADFNSYGSRRGNHRSDGARHICQRPAAKQDGPNLEGGFTKHLPDGAEMTIFEASEKYIAEGVPLGNSGGQRIRIRFVPRLGGERPAAAGSSCRHRREL